MLRKTLVTFGLMSLLVAPACTSRKEEQGSRQGAPPAAASQPAPPPKAVVETPPAQPAPSAQAEATSQPGQTTAPGTSAAPMPVAKETPKAKPRRTVPASQTAATRTAPVSTTTQTAPAVPPPEQPAQAPVAPGPVSPPPVVQAAQPPAPPPPVYVTIPAGSRISFRFTKAVDSAQNLTGDRFEGTIDSDLVVGAEVIVPKGSAASGRLLRVERSGRVEGRAAMSLELTEIRTEEQTLPVETETLNFEADGTAKQDAVKVGAGAVIGTVIGAIAGGGKGAAIGAAVGGGAGAGAVLLTRGKEVKFTPEDRLNFVLRQDLRVRIR